ncbi:MAG: ABC transporter permease [Bdellovibrionota bacterium]
MALPSLHPSVVWNAAFWDLRRRLRRRAFWLGLLMPVAIGLLGTLILSFLEGAQSHTVLVIHPKRCPAFGQMIERGIEDPIPAPDRLTLHVQRTAVEDDHLAATIRAASDNVLQGGIAAFVVIRCSREPSLDQGLPTDARLEVFGSHTSGEPASVLSRIRLTLLMHSSGWSSERSSELRRSLAKIDAQLSQKAVQVEGTAERFGSTLVSSAALMMACFFVMITNVATGPLFGAGTATSGSSRSRLEIELTVMEKEEVVAAQLLASWIVAVALLAVSTTFIFVPMLWVEALPPRAVALYCAFSVVGYMLHAPLCIVLGLVGSDGRSSSPLQSAYTLFTMLVLPVTTMAASSPNSPLIRALSYVPISAPQVALTRALILRDLPWWETTLAFLSVLATSAAMTAIAARIFHVLVLTGDRRTTLGRLFQLIRNPQLG